MSLFSKLTSKRAKLGFLSLCLTLSSTAPSFAQDAAPKKELSEKVSEELTKIKVQTDGKNFDAAIGIIDGLLKTATPGSYDVALLNQVKAQILLTKGDYPAAIAPLETAVQMSEKTEFFDARTMLDLVYYLAQLYYQEANNTKVAADQKKFYEKASFYLDRWLRTTPKPTPDAHIFYASLLYNQAQMVNPDKADPALVKRAQEEVEKSMLLTITPKETSYVLLLATLQQQQETAKAAEILELLVKQYPANKNYWQQLASSYLNLQQDVRAVLTIERAQKHGVLNTPKDNFNLVGIYFNMQQFENAIDLLEKGLHDGSIEPELSNWMLLSASYQQTRKELKAIETLKQASKLYPKDGSIDLQIAQIYYGIDKPEDAYNFAKSATTKQLEKPWQAQIFFAYAAFELKKLDEALASVKDAMKRPEAGKDAERLRRAIEDAIKERDAK